MPPHRAGRWIRCAGSIAILAAPIVVTVWPARVLGWQATLGKSRQFNGQSVAIDATGDVIAAGGGAGIVGARVAKFTGATGIEQWEHVLGDVGFSAMALDASGQVLLLARSAVVKLANDSGAALWRTDIVDSNCAGLTAVMPDPAGDVVAVGRLPGTSCDFGVVKLSGTNGSELWRYTLNGDADGSDLAWAVGVDADGNAIVAGVVATQQGPTSTVVKLRGGDGNELWRRTVPGANAGSAYYPSLGVDASGDVSVGGSTGCDNSGTCDFTVAKLAASDGAQLWQYVPEKGHVFAVRVDGAGDVVAVGDTPFHDFNAVKLSGATGGEIWRANAGGPGAYLYDVAIDDVGDAVVGGSLSDEFFVAKLIAGSGDQSWIQTIAGSAGPLGEAHSVAVAPGHVAAAGIVWNDEEAGFIEGTDFTVVDFAGGIVGKRLTMRDKAINVSKRRLKVLSKDPRILAGAAGTVDDPTVSGAVLTLTNPMTGETVSATLPATNWTAAPLKIPGFQSFRYADRTFAAGPCSSVVLRSGKQLLATCGRSGFAFSLDEPAQGSLDFRLTIGTAFEYCLHFGGTVRRDRPAVGASEGFFDATDAPAPGCPAGGP